MKNAALYLLIPLSFLITVVNAADSLSFPKLYPSSVTAYDIDQGLPISCVSKVIADDKGRLWLNPCYTLDIHRSLNFYQFDGDRSYVIPLEIPEDTLKPQAWNIRGINKKQVLFGTNGDRTRTFLFDTENEAYRIFSFKENEIIGNMIEGNNDVIYTITETHDSYSIYRLTLEEETLLTTISIALDPEPYFREGPGMPMTRVGDKIWFLDRNKGFISYSITENRIRKYDWLVLMGDILSEYPDFNQSGSIIEMANDPQGNLLFYMGVQKQIYVFDIEKERIYLHPQIKEFLSPLNLPIHTWAIFNQDKAGNLLITINWAPEGGIEAYRSTGLLMDKEGQIFDYTLLNEMRGQGRYGKASGENFYSHDFKKNVMIATAGGLITVGIKENLAIKNAFKGWPSRGIVQISKEEVLLVSELGDRGILNLENMQATLLRKEGLPHPFYRVSSLAQLVSNDDDNIWFPTERDEGKLGCYHLKDKSFSYYPVGQLFDKFNFINEREVVLVTQTNELYRYHLDDEKLIPFGRKDNLPLNLNATANEVYLSRDHIIWIASLNGLWRIDPQTGASLRLGKNEGLVDERIMCINETDEGKLLLGTLAGVQIYDPQSGKIEVINQSHGLSNDAVVGILIDEEGDQWVSTFDGITVISPEKEVLFELSEKEGLTHREFNRYSYFKTKDGKMIFGGVLGINILDPIKIKQSLLEKDKLQIYLTSLAYFNRDENKDIRVNHSFDELERIVLPPTHRYIELDFGLSDFVDPDKNIFSYRLARNTTDSLLSRGTELWTNIGAGSQLTLNDLPIGEYTILVRGINAKGQWTQHPIEVPIRVNQFFYKTWWFYIICTIPLLLVAFFWIRRLQTESQRLEAEVQIRTIQIRKDKELIEQHATKLEELDEFKSRFFTNISHEFRTPLTVINGMAEEILRNPQKWAEEGGMLILRNGKSLLNLINQILELRKLESGKLDLKYIQADIVPYLSYLTESVKSLADSKKQQLSFQSEIASLVMDYDPEKLQRIIFNLLSNAIKFTPEGGKVRLDLRVSNSIILNDKSLQTNGKEPVTLSPQPLTNKSLILTISDTGKGISSEKLPYIFDRFDQGDNSLTRTEEGTGIGLTLTQELVKLMEGEITAKSTPGEGSTFTVRLPIKQQVDKQGQEIAAEESTGMLPELPPNPNISIKPISNSNTKNGKPSLLIVEDNWDVAQYLTICLNDAYHISHAKDGQEGIEQAFAHTPDIIISDVMMPRKDGFELCQTLKLDERTSHIPIILLTAKADVSSRIIGLKRGADVYLKKPFNREELEVSLAQLIKLRQRLQTRYQGGETPAPTSDPVLQLEDAFMGKLREVILEHLDDTNFGGPELGSELGLGKSSLHAKIKALTGRTPAMFIRLIRVNKAKELLSTTNLNISQIAYDVGFEDPSYFARCFAKEFGVTPRQFRK